MIFQHTWQQVLDGSKTQTRRLVQSGDELRDNDESGLYIWHVDDGWCGHEGPGPACYPGRIRWQVGRTYAIQPGRGKKAVGRIRITGIRQEPVQNLCGEDAFHEGIEAVRNVIDSAALSPLQYASAYGYWYNDDYDAFNESEDQAAIATYAALWNTIHTKPGTRWQDNPLVWVLTIQVLHINGKQVQS